VQRKEQATVPDSGEARSGEDSLDWSAKVELFEQIRREYEFGIGTAALEDAGRRGNSATWRIGSGSGFDRRCRIARSANGLCGNTCTVRKLALGLIARETCVPQSYAWGSEARVEG